MTVIRQLADAIAYLHDLGNDTFLVLRRHTVFAEKRTVITSVFIGLYFTDIVHRDLKLENILLCQPVDEEPLNIKVRYTLVLSVDE